MAMKIVADADVQRAIAERGPLKVVVLPVENHMRAEVLPRGAAEAFVGRLRTLLARRNNQGAGPVEKPEGTGGKLSAGGQRPRSGAAQQQRAVRALA